MERTTIPQRLIELKEWQPAEIALTAEELSDLQGIHARLSIQPDRGRFVVTPQSIIGAASTPRLHVTIRPKMPIDRVFFLVGYARRIRFEPDLTALAEREGIVELFVAAFLNALQLALRRGLPMGYVVREEALPVIRGRMRFADQFRRHYGLPLPVEVRYDEYTIDTEANRLLKAALRRIGRLRLRDAKLRRRAAEALPRFDGVSDVKFDPSRLPTFSYTRLDERFRPVLEQAALIVRNSSVELEPGTARTSSILFDMNDVFEDYVWAAIGDELKTFLPVAYRWKHGAPVVLDEDAHLFPEPDLSLWHRSRCVFVGDAKYKTTAQGEINDLYQLLAYCLATGLDEGLLLYAEKSGGQNIHRVVGGGPRLRVETVDVTAPLAELQRRCRELAASIAALAAPAAPLA